MARAIRHGRCSELSSLTMDRKLGPGNCGHVAVQLSMDARNQPDRAIWQLAQEVPHVLSPTGRANTATVFEEGICGVFARNIAELWELNRWIGKPRGGRYGTAADLVQLLLDAHPDLVCQLRGIQPCISAIDVDLLVSACPIVSRKVASALCQPFSVFTPRKCSGARNLLAELREVGRRRNESSC
jgi:hypothetical protein